jgi:hypothetical protein
MSNSGGDLEPVPWLTRAREQALELARARSDRHPPPLELAPVRRSFAHPPQVAAALALLFASVASAWVAHVRTRAALVPPTATVQEGTRALSPVHPAGTPAVTPPAGGPIARAKPRPAKRPIVRASPPPRSTLLADPEEPFGDVIMVQPRAKQSPLFSPEEYKARGLQPGR